jgi:uncharacterized integral membrane protein
MFMNGRGFGALNVATGISLLPITHDSRPLFVAALSFFVCGLIILTTATILARKGRKSEAKAS